MYNVTLINLSADARTAAANGGGNSERSGVSPDELRVLLENFCELDAVQNVTADPEIRIQTRHENYLVRTGQKKLFLYDVLNREAPAQVLTPAQVIAELDGSAMAARSSAPFLFASMAADAEPELTAVAPPRAELNLPRVIAMTAVAAVLLGAIIYLRASDNPSITSVHLTPVEPTELEGLRAALAGVYMTGSQPGQHGIVLTTTGELKIFEVNALAAPGVVYAKGEPGRSGPKLFLATNQPGGLIEVVDNDALIYCGETYRRIP